MQLDVYKEVLEWVDFDLSKKHGFNEYILMEAEKSFPHFVALTCAEEEFYDKKARGISPPENMKFMTQTNSRRVRDAQELKSVYQARYLVR